MSDSRRSAPLHGLLIDQLAEERARKTSLEQRGVAVVATSGTIITIAAGFVTLSAAPSVTGGVSLIVWGIVGLLLASVGGLASNIPKRSAVVDAATFADVAQQATWTAVDREREEYAARVRLLTTLRARNGQAAKVLFISLVVELASIAVLAADAMLRSVQQ